MTADGCVTLDVKGFGTVTDSYGTLSSNPPTSVEFANGAVPGWEAHLTPESIDAKTGIGIGYRLDVIQAAATP